MIQAAVLGSDVSKSRSPAIHRAAYRAMGVQGTFEALSVDEGRFPALLAELGERGFLYVNVTIPHKAAAAASATTRSASVRRCAAANTLIYEPGPGHPIHAENTDGHGLLAALADLGTQADGQEAVLIGAGGAAAGALDALLGVGSRVRLVARRVAAAHELVDKLGPNRKRHVTVHAWEGDGLAKAVRGSRILISSVPASAWETADSTRGLEKLARESAVLEMAYGTPGGSPLSRAVRGQVRRYADGLGMLVHQAARAIELALGEAPPLAPLFTAARI